jgi:hypothetical protein
MGYIKGVGRWCVVVMRGTTLSFQHANSREYFFNITSGYGDVVATTYLLLWVYILHPKNKTNGFLGEILFTMFLSTCTYARVWNSSFDKQTFAIRGRI